MTTGSVIFIDGKWVSKTKSDVRSLILVSLMGLLFSIALVMAIVHPTGTQDVDAVSVSGP